MAGPSLSSTKESWEVPTVWKLASVIPVYRKDMREDPGNNRAVRLISVTGKIRITES